MKKIIHNVTGVIGEVADHIGIDIIEGQGFSLYKEPKEETKKESKSSNTTTSQKQKADANQS